MADLPKQPKIINDIPAVIADGHGIGISHDNGGASLLFIQLTPSQMPNTPPEEGRVVSSIRMNIDQLKQFSDDIAKNIDAYEKNKK